MSEGEGADRQRGTVKGRAGECMGGGKKRKSGGFKDEGRHKVELELFSDVEKQESCRMDGGESERGKGEGGRC